MFASPDPDYSKAVVNPVAMVFMNMSRTQRRRWLSAYRQFRIAGRLASSAGLMGDDAGDSPGSMQAEVDAQRAKVDEVKERVANGDQLGKIFGCLVVPVFDERFLGLPHQNHIAA